MPKWNLTEYSNENYHFKKKEEFCGLMGGATIKIIAIFAFTDFWLNSKNLSAFLKNVLFFLKKWFFVRPRAVENRYHWLISPLNPKAPSSDQGHMPTTGLDMKHLLQLPTLNNTLLLWHFHKCQLVWHKSYELPFPLVSTVNGGWNGSGSAQVLG